MNTTTKKNVATVRVKTDAEKPIDIDLIAESIAAVAGNFEKALKSGLTMRAIVLLVHDAIPAKFSVSKKDIELVLQYAPIIKTYLNKK